MFPPLCACRKWVFLLYFPFFPDFILFLGTAVHIQQIDIVLLQRAVLILLLYVVLLMAL